VTQWSRTKSSRKLGCAANLLLCLLSLSCSGAKLGGVLESSAFVAQDRPVESLRFSRSIPVRAVGGGAFRPSDVVVLPSGSLVAVDESRGRAAVFREDGSLEAYLETPPTFRPSIVARARRLEIYLMDRFASSLYRFDSRGRPAGAVSLAEGRRRFAGACVDKAGRLYASDQENDEVIVLDPAGGGTVSFGGLGDAPGEFDDPAGLAVDQRNRLYVCDAGNSRIQVTDRWGGVFAVWLLSGPGCVPRPKAIAVDGWGNAFVTDTGCKCLRVLRPSGAEVLRIEGSGPGLGFTREPGGLDLSGEELLVADPAAGAIQVFEIVYAD